MSLKMYLFLIIDFFFPGFLSLISKHVFWVEFNIQAFQYPGLVRKVAGGYVLLIFALLQLS